MAHNEVVIVNASRTPIGQFRGRLKNVSAVQLGSYVIKAVLKQVGVRGD